MKLVLPTLYEWQKDALDKIRQSKDRYIFIKSLRQMTGKTYLLMVALLCTAFDKQGSKSLLIEPVYNQCTKVFNDITVACKDVIKNANKSTNEITFINGSIIYLRSAEAGDSIRGLTVTGICCVDEACYITNEFIDTLLPVVNKHKCLCVFASSPALTSGFFYDNYSSGEYTSINWSKYVNQVYTQDELDEYKRLYSKRKYTTEILGEFWTIDGSLFTGIENCIGDTVDDSPVVFGIDWGVSGDYTAITCLNTNKQVVWIKYTNDKSPIEQIDWIVTLINEYNPIKITVEQNSIGAVYRDLLQKRIKQRIIGFNTDNSSKNRIVNELQVALENRDIQIIRDDELLTELRMYKEEMTPSGRITFNASSGYHDDLVMSLMIAYDSIRSRGYCLGSNKRV